MGVPTGNENLQFTIELGCGLRTEAEGLQCTDEFGDGVPTVGGCAQRRYVCRQEMRSFS